MAKQKNPWIKYLVILGIALVLLLISFLKNRRYQQETSLVFDLKKEDITAISIMSSEDTVSFRQLNDTTWTPIEPDTGDINVTKVNRLITGLVELKQTGIPTENPEKHTTYNVNSGSTLIDLKKGEDVLESFYLGRSKSSFSHGYLRFKGENTVYRINKNLSYLARPNPEAWQQ